MNSVFCAYTSMFHTVESMVFVLNVYLNTCAKYLLLCDIKPNQNKLLLALCVWPVPDGVQGNYFKPWNHHYRTHPTSVQTVDTFSKLRLVAGLILWLSPWKVTLNTPVFIWVTWQEQLNGFMEHKLNTHSNTWHNLHKCWWPTATSCIVYRHKSWTIPAVVHLSAKPEPEDLAITQLEGISVLYTVY